MRWNRDLNHDFIDDEILKRFKPNERVNVVVDLNRYLSPTQIHALLSQYGKIKYIGKTITFVHLDGVLRSDLPAIAGREEVAMVEWRAPLRFADSVGSRVIEARNSITYPNTSADGWTGKNVNIAIVDSGVDNRHKAFRKSGHFNDPDTCDPDNTRFVAGYDATTDYNISSCQGWDAVGHGTHVAGIALGLPTVQPPTIQCLPLRAPDNVIPTECGGVAPDAGLIDVKVCELLDSCSYLERGLDWIKDHADFYHIKVVNISLADRCLDDNGNSHIPLLIDTLVDEHKLAIVIAHGNAYIEDNNPNTHDCIVGARITASPGSSSKAMTVSGSEDSSTVNYSVTRSDDIAYDGGLSGPRSDFDAHPSVAALKPDFSAPAANIGSAVFDTIGDYTDWSGTSMAAPFVAGAAALIIQSQPNIDPATLKQLLRQQADSSRNGPKYSVFDPVWATRLGSGIITLRQALPVYDAVPPGTPMGLTVK
jgi:serine protease AprX